MDVERRQRPVPDDAVLVVVLFDVTRHDAINPDTVTPHNYGMLFAALIEKRRMQGI